MNDHDVIDFIVKGYRIVESDLPDAFHQNLCQKLEEHLDLPHHGIQQHFPEIEEVANQPRLKNSLAALLGNDFTYDMHTHWHMISPEKRVETDWHQDGNNSRDHILREVLLLYYPHDITPELAPTIVMPGTQYRNAPTDRLKTYYYLKGQEAVTVRAGSVAIVDYALWHTGSSNRTSQNRHMLKFSAKRISEPLAPSWEHDPEQEEYLTRNMRLINPTACGQSDYYKEMDHKQALWNYLCGKNTSIKKTA